MGDFTGFGGHLAVTHCAVCGRPYPNLAEAAKCQKNDLETVVEY